MLTLGEERKAVMPRHHDDASTSRLARLIGCAGLALLVGLGPPASVFAQEYRGGRQGFERNQAIGRMPAARPYPGMRNPGREGRPSRYPPGRGPGGWGPAVGGGIVGGLIIDHARRPPVYDPYEPELPRPRRPRRPVIVEDYEEEAPVLRRKRPPPPVRQAAPARTRHAAPPPAAPPPRIARPAPRQPNVIVPPASEDRLVSKEILFELAPNAQADAVLRRHRATLMASRRFDLAGVTIIRARLDGGRSARTVLAEMARDRQVASAQPNYLYTLQQEVTKDAAQPAGTALPAPEMPPAKPDEPAPVIAVPDLPPVEPLVAVAPKRELQPQYVVEKLALEDAHKLVRGEKIRVAVIDSGADMAHPELQGVVAGSFDALGGEVQPHAHGTAMAAAILAQAQLQGVAPAARLLAARAFTGSGTPGAANGTTFHILSALDWAAGEGARVFNLSFAGPQDRLMSRSLAGARGKGIVAIAAAGNGGTKAAPLYPGADPNVIAVTATDAEDKLFPSANRGDYVAVAAPGVDVLAAEPEGRYAFSSGTSIAAAHVSGLVALLLEKRPDLDLEGVRKLLSDSAIDLGAKGRDPLFGAGRIDVPAALARALPVSAVRP
jgi:hypothetical protein